MLDVKDLCVSYGEVEILHGVSFHVGEGEIVALVGANAAGKTTIVSAISGIVPIRSGEIYFENEKTKSLPAHVIVERGILQIPEGRHVFPAMTVLENLQMGAYTKKARPRMEETLKTIFGLFPRLEERQRQLAGSLSGGEAQMLAIARGLMALPKLLMLDEPSLGLAPSLVKNCFEIVRNLNQQSTTILLIEQNVRQSLEIAHRAYVLENGKILLSGTGRELLSDDQVRKAYLGM
jgi:branched-chain amino acid transport system ATP-binding protein